MKGVPYWPFKGQEDAPFKANRTCLGLNVLGKICMWSQKNQTQVDKKELKLSADFVKICDRVCAEYCVNAI